MGFLMEKELKYLHEELDQPGQTLRRHHGRRKSFR